MRLTMELKLLRRDPIVVYTLIAMLAIMLLTRYSRPRLEPLYQEVAFLSMVFIPLVFGMIPGLISADEKEEGTCQALMVLPIKNWFFLLYRFLWVSLATLLLVLISPKILGIKVPRILPVLLVMEAWIYGLMLMKFSNSRMQAMTLAKVFGWLLLLPVAVKLVVEWRNLSFDWSRLFAFVPTYWTYEMFLNQGNLLIALVVHVLWVFALVFISRTS
ncbi:ABC transporter permease [Pyrococcus kukulkanii]|uniref:Permease n=1 Tax=Pyrococcus kukulkanii TaxID=1609559 RepID=A0A127B9E2_9EURY|nr:ABC transporter permease [Pyrococcus kukulkanii]AMM53983.1 hypothetical protein TQ32_05435 [Pyrococcus kukulkanii]